MSTSSESMRNADAAWSRVDVLMGAINVLVQMAQERLEADHALGRSLSPSGLIQLAGDFDRLYTLAVNVGGICTGICRPARQALQAELSALQGETMSQDQRLLYSAGMARLSSFQEAERTIAVLAESALRDTRLLKDLATGVPPPPDAMAAFEQLLVRLRGRA